MHKAALPTIVTAGENVGLSNIERTLKLRIRRGQLDGSNAGRPQRIVQNTLASRTLTALPGEVFV
jgi:hypothetical protein